MAKKRAPVDDDDDDFGGGDSQQQGCTTMDHVYPSNPQPETRCYCGKKQWKPFIALDDYLKPGMIIRTVLGGPLYNVEMVNQSRARCRLITVQAALNRRAEDQADEGPLLMPIPGSEEWDEASTRTSDDDEAEQRGRVINISPQSACIRVSKAELETEIQLSKPRSREMAAVAGIPVAGGTKKSNAQINKERLAKLASKPNGTARPLTGAAAKAKASARPKAQKTVRECGCGCKGETTAYFMPGHDARFKGWLKKTADGRMTIEELKKAMGPKQFAKYTFKKTGAGFTTKTTYQEAAEA